MASGLRDKGQPLEATGAAGDMPRLAILLGLAFILRLAISLGLHIRAHMVSDYPLFSLATKLRVPDALDFHHRAVAIGKQWQDVPFLGMFVHSSQRDHWAMPLAWMYDLFGQRPWAVSIVLCLCYLAMGFVAYSLARAMDQPPRRARWLAALISLWPTTLVWSALPMRDGPFMLAVFMFLASLAWLNTTRPLGPAKATFCSLGLILGTGTAYILKGYMLWAMPAVALCLWAVMLVRNLFVRSKTPWLRLFLAPMLVLAVLGLLNHAMYPSVTPKPPAPAAAKPAVKAPPKGQAAVSPKPAPPPEPQQASGGLFDRLWKKIDRAKAFLEKSRYLSLLEQHPSYKGTGLSPGGAQGRYGLSRQSWGDILAQFAQGFWQVLTFPPPWQRWPAQESWGVFTVLVSLLSVFWYLLLPGIWAGMLRGAWRLNPAGAVLLIWSLFLGLAMGWTMLNLGTIFRIREIIMLPMLAAFTPGLYMWLARAVGLKRGNSQKPA